MLIWYVKIDGIMWLFYILDYHVKDVIFSTALLILHIIKIWANLIKFLHPSCDCLKFWTLENVMNYEMYSVMRKMCRLHAYNGLHCILWQKKYVEIIFST